MVKEKVEKGNDLNSDDGGLDKEERTIASQSKRGTSPFVRFHMHENYIKEYI